MICIWAIYALNQTLLKFQCATVSSQKPFKREKIKNNEKNHPYLVKISIIVVVFSTRQAHFCIELMV